MKVARVTLSDRATAGVYADRSGPEIERVWAEQGGETAEWLPILIADYRPEIEATLRRLCDDEHCDLILT